MTGTRKAASDAKPAVKKGAKVATEVKDAKEAKDAEESGDPRKGGSKKGEKKETGLPGRSTKGTLSRSTASRGSAKKATKRATNGAGRESGRGAWSFFITSKCFELFLFVALFQRMPRFALFSFVIANIACVTAYRLIPRVAPKLGRRGLAGYDLNKLDGELVAALRQGKSIGAEDGRDEKSAAVPLRKFPEKIPECGGLMPAIIYIGAAIIGVTQLDAEQHLNYVAGITAVAIVTFLGFVDDVLELRWRHKLILPHVASLPLIFLYDGPTTIHLPVRLTRLVHDLCGMRTPVSCLRSAAHTAFSHSLSELSEKVALIGSALKRVGEGWGGGLQGNLQSSLASGLSEGQGKWLALAPLDIGILYRIYMSLVSGFTTNAINIYAGINGLETGQSLVVAAFTLLLDLVKLRLRHPTLIFNLNLDPDVDLEIENDDSQITYAAGAHKSSFLLSLLFWNVTLALHFFNKYPALTFVGDTFTAFAGMHFAAAAVMGHSAKSLLLLFAPQILNFLISLPQLLRFVPCPKHRVPDFNPATGKLESSGNYTLINLFLEAFGPMNERDLTKRLLLFQTLCGVAAFSFLLVTGL